MVKLNREQVKNIILCDKQSNCSGCEHEYKTDEFCDNLTHTKKQDILETLESVWVELDMYIKLYESKQNTLDELIKCNNSLSKELDKYKTESIKISSICKYPIPSTTTTDIGKCIGGLLYDAEVVGKYKRVEDCSPCKICPRYKGDQLK